MKHCAKKLLGLVFALALCLAVGGNALADGPEAADVWMLSDAWMLADEPNVTTAPDTTTVGDLANDGYTVTIPTTVTVNSGTDTGELMVTASVKQLRTLKITLDSANKWQLKHESGQVLAGYSLTTTNGGEWLDGQSYWSFEEYSADTGKKPLLSLVVGQKAEGVSDTTWSEGFTIPMIVQVKDTSQATMSGTYTDTVCFEFDLTKQCYTYIINVYGQKVELTNNTFNTGAKPALSYQALRAVDMVNDADAPYTEQYVLEYGFDFNGNLLGSAPGSWQHTVPAAEETRKAIDGTKKTFTADEAADYALRWETLDAYPIDPVTDYATSEATGDKIKTKTIDLNLKRKWYWLDVNGVTNKDTSSGNLSTDGNQGGHIGSFLDIRVSPDDGTTWSRWYWYSYGDDYWGTFPYGTTFELGLHHVKDGYVYDEDTAGNLALFANGVSTTYLTTPEPSNDGRTTYRVYQGKLEGEPCENQVFTTPGGGYVHAAGSYPRYCYNVCFVDGITYYANGGTGGKEDINDEHHARTSFQYTAGMTLAEPKTTTGCNFTAPAGKVFMGWSTTPDYTATAGQVLYAPGDSESIITWPAKPDRLPNDGDFMPQDGKTENRTLYAIWGYEVNIKIQFEDETGYTDSTAQVHEGGIMDDTTYSVTLHDQKVLPGSSWTLDLSKETVPEQVKTAIDTATARAKTMAGDNDATTTDADFKYKVWKLAEDFVEKGDCTVKVPADVTADQTLPLKIKRRRYLLSVLSTDANTGTIADLVTKDEEKYGTFNVVVNSTLEANQKSFYQCGWNYGASYTVSNVKAATGFNSMDMLILKSLAKDDVVASLITQWRVNLTAKNEYSYSSYVTEKQDGIHYYRLDGSVLQNSGGDPVRVIFYDTPTTSSTTPMPGPSLAPARKALTLRYHANFAPNEELALDLDPDPLLDDMDDTFGFDPDPLLEDVDDALEGAVKTVSYQPGEDVVLRNCMFKRSGYVFVGWNTEPDGTGRLYRVNGVPITDWAAGDTVDLYAQWKKPDHLKPVVDNEPFVPTDPDTPPEELDPGFGIDPDADPADEEGPADDADAVDDAPAVADEEAAAAPPEELDFGFGIDPDAAVGGPAPFVRW